MKYLRYSGEFLSRAGIVWRAEIWQEADQQFSVGSLEFDASRALSIEWKHQKKEDVICGSTATLKLISPDDRTYEDLYTIEVGRIQLNVYRNDTLYWSGLLDPEFYEEPYQAYRGYVVELTFSDFGILARKKYTLTGMQDLLSIVRYCLTTADLKYLSIETSYVSTTLSDGSAITGGALSVRSDNFIDEDGKASTLKEVLTGILQPLALRIIQRAGRIYIYDLNGLYNKGRAASVEWDGSSQTMGVDKVANNVVITFSPYSGSSLMKEDDLEYGGKYDTNHINLTSDGQSDPEYGDYYSYYPDYNPDHKVDGNWDYRLVDFTIFTHQKGKGLAAIGSSCRYFHFQPITGGGSECSGVAYAFRTGGHGSIDTGWPKWKVHNSIPHAGKSMILQTNKVFLPKLAEDEAKKYRVRLALELMIDARYNPLSGSDDYNDVGNDKTLKVCSAFVFVPVVVTLYDDNGKALYHYKNRNIAAGSSIGHLGWAKGSWEAGEDPGGDCYLEYYKSDDLKEDAGIRGWTKNRHCIGRPDGEGGRTKAKIYDSFAKMGDGEYMPYPPVSGYLEVKVLAGINGYDYGNDSSEFEAGDSQWDNKNLYKKLRWNLYKAPVLDVVNYNLVFDAAELKDIEYSGYINKAAKEQISIDTICGTSNKICPTARGSYYRTSDGLQIQSLTRAGRTDHPEKLLIGTLYSQYADRKTVLKGEALINGGMNYYTEQNQAGKRFLLMSDVQNVIMDCTSAEYCEFRPDEYDSTTEK